MTHRVINGFGALAFLDGFIEQAAYGFGYMEKAPNSSVIICCGTWIAFLVCALDAILGDEK